MPIGTSDGQYFENVYDQYTQSQPKQERIYVGRTPLESSEKPAGEFKSSGGTQTPENASKVIATIPIAKQLGLQGADITEADVDQAINIGLSAGPGTIAGVRSKLVDRNALAEAQIMKANGAHPDDVFKQTGFYQGSEGRWRYEIDDSASKLKDWYDKTLTSEPQIAKLPEVLDHPELYKAYPHLKDIEVIHDPKLTQYGGYWDAENNAIVVGSQLASHKETFLHEIQHAIQSHEGFSKGGGALSAGQDYPLLFTPDVLKLSQEAEGLIEARRNRPLTSYEWQRKDYLTTVFKKYQEYVQAANDKARDLYDRLSGETEARNVETRANLSEQQRRNIPPWWTEDIPGARQIPVPESVATTAYGLRDRFGRIAPVK